MIRAVPKSTDLTNEEAAMLADFRKLDSGGRDIMARTIYHMRTRYEEDAKAPGVPVLKLITSRPQP